MIVIVPCLRDNYAYLVVDPETCEAAVVDPSEANPVVEAVRRDDLRLRAVWSTHHHWDHVGGNVELARQIPALEVYGHSSDRGRIPGQTRFLESGERFHLGRLAVLALHVPGHTTGALAYVVTGPGEPGSPPSLFTGDTLFLGGCGRLFEGTAAQMFASLSELARLPADARIYCGHEYTVANLRFAAHVEPSNSAIDRARQAAEAKVAAGAPTVPGTVAAELETNPFLRVGSSEIRGSLSISADASGAEAFARIRTAKDSFK